MATTLHFLTKPRIAISSFGTLSVVSQNKSFNTKIMKAITFIPSTDTDRMVWLNNFAIKIPGYASILNITANEVASIQKDAAAFAYIINMQESFKQTLQQINAYKSLMKHAVDQQHIGSMPVVPVLASPPAVVPEGIFDRISKLAQRIKASVNYNTHIGADLGIISSNPKTDTSTLQPTLNIYMDAGFPHLKWKKGITKAIDIYVDRNDGTGFNFMGRYLRNEFIDKTSISNNSTLMEWHYKGVYVIADKQIGLFSQVSSITVKKL